MSESSDPSRRWAEIEALFSEAMELPAEARERNVGCARVRQRRQSRGMELRRHRQFAGDGAKNRGLRVAIPRRHA
jgi:hypothetical protein